MLNLELNVTTITVASREQMLAVDLTKLSADILRSLFAYGVQQKIGDAASGAKADAIAAKFGDEPNKADVAAWLETESATKAIGESAARLMQKAYDALLEGKWAIRQGSGTSTKYSEETQLALDMAKNDLALLFKANGTDKLKLRATAENFATKCGAKVAAFFTERAKKYVWNDTRLLEYIDAQQLAAKRDYRAEALAELARRAEQVAELAGDTELADMFADL